MNVKDWLVDTGLGRLVIWIMTVIGLIAVNTLLYYYKSIEPEVFTGILIAVVTVAPFIYQGFVAVPILSIEVPRSEIQEYDTGEGKKDVEADSRKPTLDVEPALYRKPTYRAPCGCAEAHRIGYLRLRVRNRGLVAAEDCVFQVKIIEWPCPEECHVPSNEYHDWVDVTWADLEKSITVRPNDVRYATITVMPLTPLDLEGHMGPCLPVLWRHNVNQCIGCKDMIVAWIARREVFEHGCENRPQDGLVPGEYKISVQVTCRNGKSGLQKPLKLRIAENWHDTDIYLA
ncbi:MAG: hypothetical protein RXP86_10715 [Acidilobus sp.]